MYCEQYLSKQLQLYLYMVFCLQMIMDTIPYDYSDVVWSWAKMFFDPSVLNSWRQKANAWD